MSHTMFHGHDTVNLYACLDATKLLSATILTVKPLVTASITMDMIRSSLIILLWTWSPQTILYSHSQPHVACGFEQQTITVNPAHDIKKKNTSSVLSSCSQTTFCNISRRSWPHIHEHSPHNSYCYIPPHLVCMAPDVSCISINSSKTNFSTSNKH